MLSKTELILVTDLCELLFPFYELTIKMSATKYATVSVILPGLTRLLDILGNFESKGNNYEIDNLVVDAFNDLNDRSKPYFEIF